MSYTRVNWQDAPSVSTPLSASNLNKMDAGIKQNADDIEALQQHSYDSALNDTSTNAPQTKVVKKAIEDAVESVTIITDPTLSNEGQAADAKATGDAIGKVFPEATAGDVGKALIVKTVEDGKATAYEYGEAGGSVEIDPTLSIEGQAADAKVTGDAIRALQIEDTVSGAIVSITDGSANPIQSLSVSLSPIQDLHGQDAPYPAGGGKNLMVPIAYSGGGYNLNIGTVLELTEAEPQPTVNGNTITYSAANWGGFTFKTNPLSAGTYVVHADVTNTPNRRLTFYVVRSSDNAIKQKTPNYNMDIENRTYTVEDGDYIAFFCGISPEGTVTLKDLQTEAGGFTSWSPYENLCPISGRDSVTAVRTGKNLWGGDRWYDSGTGTPDLENRTISGATSASLPRIMFNAFKPNTAYTLMLTMTNTSTTGRAGFAFYYTDGTSTTLGNNAIGATKGTYVWTSNANKTLMLIDRVTYSGTKTIWVDESGIFEGALTAADFTPYDGQSVTVQLGQTVYGGTVDVTGGKVPVDRICVSFNGTETWTKSSHYAGSYYISSANFRSKFGAAFKPNTPFKCSHAKSVTSVAQYVYGTCFCDSFVSIRIMPEDSTLNDWKAYLQAQHSAGTPVQVCCEITEPFTVPLASSPVPTTKNGLNHLWSDEPYDIDITPASLSTLKGDNTVWSDGDSVEMTYIADPKLYIDKKITAAVAALA